MAAKVGTGVIYNVARVQMLSGAFRWTDPGKYMTLADPSYVFDEGHMTVADTIGFIGDVTFDGTVPPIPGLFISEAGWAGSAPVAFSDVSSMLPVGSVLIWYVIDLSGNLQDDANYGLIACLTSFPGGPIYPDGAPFSLTFDQSLGQQGWFRP